jgi:hypothetical protein
MQHPHETNPEQFIRETRAKAPPQSVIRSKLPTAGQGSEHIDLQGIYMHMQASPVSR